MNILKTINAKNAVVKRLVYFKMLTKRKWICLLYAKIADIKFTPQNFRSKIEALTKNKRYNPYKYWAVAFSLSTRTLSSRAVYWSGHT